MKLATWNVNSVRARLARLLPWLDGQRPGIVCLQETKCRDEAFPREPIEELGYNVETFGQKTYNGVAILSRRRIYDVAEPALQACTGAEIDVEARRGEKPSDHAPLLVEL